jgi:hypothetical protein
MSNVFVFYSILSCELRNSTSTLQILKQRHLVYKRCSVLIYIYIYTIENNHWEKMGTLVFRSNNWCKLSSYHEYIKKGNTFNSVLKGLSPATGILRLSKLLIILNLIFDPHSGPPIHPSLFNLPFVFYPSRRVVTSTWWEGLVLPMIPRAMPAGA